MSNPKYVKVDNKLYKINTDFRVALECNNISEDTSIGDYERALAIIYKLFGEEGLNCDNQNKLIELGLQYLSLGSTENQFKTENNEDYELDFNKCRGLIESSFKFDYKYNPYQLEYLHWYDFYNDLCNLSTSEFGNCCILNRIIGVLNTKASEIKDNKQRTEVVKAQEEIKEKYCKLKQKEMTEEQKRSSEEFYKALGF